MRSITIGVAEDQIIFRKGLVDFLNSLTEVNVISEGNDGNHLLTALKEQNPDIIILNHNSLFDGVGFTKNLRDKYPEVKIILMSARFDDKNILLAIENGANGFLSKDDDQPEIEKAVFGVIDSNYYVNDRVSKVLINNMKILSKISPNSESDGVKFTKDEMRILQMISKEFTTQQIADELCKSVRTIEKYRTKMLLKVGAQNTVGMIIYAIKNELIEI